MTNKFGKRLRPSQRSVVKLTTPKFKENELNAYEFALDLSGIVEQDGRELIATFVTDEEAKHFASYAERIGCKVRYHERNSSRVYFA